MFLVSDKIFKTKGFDGRIDSKLAGSLSQKCRLAGSRLDHQKPGGS